MSKPLYKQKERTNRFSRNTLSFPVRFKFRVMGLAKLKPYDVDIIPPVASPISPTPKEFPPPSSPRRLF